METIEERRYLLNQQCSNCDGSLARHWCLDCYEALCGDCVTAHRRVTLTRSHRILNQPHNDDDLISPIKFCTLHPLEPLRLFCFTCNHLTCRDCQLLAHKNHRFSFVGEALDSLKQKMDACMQPIRAQMEASRKSLQDMETRLKVLARSELHLTNSLQEVFRSLSELLKVRLERLTREIQTVYDLEREMIKGRMLKVKEMQECQRSVGEAAEKAQNSRDLLVVLPCVEQVASQVKDLMDQDLSPPPNMIYLKVTTDRQTVESMFTFGKLLLSWVPFHVSKEFKESVEPPPVSTTTSQHLTSTSTKETHPAVQLSTEVQPATNAPDEDRIGPFSPVSSEDHFTVIVPQGTNPSKRPETGKFESATREPEETESYGRAYSPISSVDEIIPPEETRSTEVHPATSAPDEDRVGLFLPVSSEDELSSTFTKASDLTLNISETSDNDTEDPPSLQMQQRDFNLSHWQPKVSLVRLPVSPPGHKRLEFVLRDDDDMIHLKEPLISDEDSDVTEDFTKSVSSDSPMFVEVISCSACVSPSASKICCMCGRGYHMDCHVPPVGPDIWSEWICSLCQDLSDPSDPYSSDRPKSLQGTGLSPLDQRRCEMLLLHLKVEGCRHFSESDLWSDVVLISERLTHLRPLPYQTTAQLVSDLWTLFEDSLQSNQLEKLQHSFQKKLKETLGAELPPSLLVAPKSDKAGAEGPSSSVRGAEMPREQEDFKEVRKRLRDFLGLKFASASKRTKKH
uniref:Tripartite motif-containing 33-like n=1 Tax=Iconisemion striatum TaxID=60296 RepID=A0A1A7XJZ8_9TELE